MKRKRSSDHLFHKLHVKIYSYSLRILLFMVSFRISHPKKNHKSFLILKKRKKLKITCLSIFLHKETFYGVKFPHTEDRIFNFFIEKYITAGFFLLSTSK